MVNPNIYHSEVVKVRKMLVNASISGFYQTTPIGKSPRIYQSSGFYSNIYNVHGCLASKYWHKYNNRANWRCSLTVGSFTLHFGLKYEIIYQLDAIEYLFVFFQLDVFRAYTPIFRSNGCYNFFTYAAYVKKL